MVKLERLEAPGIKVAALLAAAAPPLDNVYGALA
jgi:hypothetical protein